MPVFSLDIPAIKPNRALATLEPGAKILVAVSGGPDSVALAHFLRGLPYRLVIGHVDHQLRQGSAQDARFVQKLAKEWDLPCLVKRVNVKKFARTHQTGIEEAAREVRYRVLGEMAQKERCSAIITGHTAGDQAETVLMNFLRGSGPTGLAGMSPRRYLEKSGIPVIRPLLNMKRSQILQYLKRHALAFREDPTNKALRFSRNRIRHITLPYLERMAPGLSDRLLQGADVFRQEEDFWGTWVSQEAHKITRKKGRGFTVVLPRLLGYHKALSRRILRHLLPGSSFQDIEQVLQLAQSPKKEAWLQLPGSRWVRRKKNTLIVIEKRTQ